MAMLPILPVIVLLLSLLNVGIVHSVPAAAADSEKPSVPKNAPEAVTPSPAISEAASPATSDEHPAATPQAKCAKGKFYCGDFWETCIDEDKRCDNHIDCPETGADEASCATDLVTIDSEEFLQSAYLFCKPGEFRCESGKCIPTSSLCNGVADCPDADDEGGHCGACEGFGCSNKCQDKPTGPECLCGSNMSLQVDGRTCAFDDLCEKHGHRCAQFCDKSTDRLTCRCASGYTLKNETECEADKQFRNGHLYFTQGDRSINRVPLFKDAAKPGAAKPNVPEEVVPSRPTSEKISSIAFNPNKDSVYFTINDHRSAKIMAKASNTSWGVTPLYDGHGIKHIAYDWVADNIYYAADGLGIGVCSGDGRFCSHLITGRQQHQNERLQSYGNLLVHPKLGIMIWVDINHDHPNGVVMKADLDGKETSVLSSAAARPILMTSLDYVRDELYILEGEDMTVLNLHTLRSRPFTNHIHAWAMIPFSGRLNYIARENKELVVAVGNSLEARHALEGSQFSMAIDNKLYYDNIESPCEKLKCDHMCVLRRPSLLEPLAGKCICPDKYTMQPDGHCAFDREIDGPVKTASQHMDEWCSSGRVCQVGGSCKAGGYEHLEKKTTPACECLPGYSGLYCEIRTPHTIMQRLRSGRALTFLLILLFGSLLVPLAFYLVRTNPAWLDRLRSTLGLQPSHSSSIIPTFVASPSRGGQSAGAQNDAILISTE